MNAHRKNMKIKSVAVVALIALALMLGQSFSGAEPMARDHTVKADTNKHNIKSINKALKLKDAIASIDKAIKAIDANDKKAAKAELLKAKKTLANAQKIIEAHSKPKFVNDRCPIMGSPITPGRVTKNLIREFQGQQVAFCCAGCPATWDKLSDAQKKAKLSKVKAQQKIWTCSMHPEIKANKPGSCPKCNMKLIPAKQKK